jgi:hypothetical protein
MHEKLSGLNGHFRGHVQGHPEVERAGLPGAARRDRPSVGGRRILKQGSERIGPGFVKAMKDPAFITSKSSVLRTGLGLPSKKCR